MTQVAVRRLPLGLAVVAAIAVVAVWVVFAAPAKASSTFSSGLAAAAKPASKIEVQQSAPYTEAASPKRMTRTASAKASKRLTASPGARTAVAASASSELTRARALLASQIRQHPILKGSSVEFGKAYGHQAICYYKTGRIVISPSHTVSLERIMNHEVWHIIDWRDNGRIDWGENIPPR